MREWVLIVCAGLLTYATRASFLVFGEKIALTPVVRRSLRYVGPAAFAAIAAPAVLGGGTDADWPKIAGATAALAVMYKTRNLTACVVAGMAVFWITRSLGF